MIEANDPFSDPDMDRMYLDFYLKTLVWGL
jgi:hypothetical protein